MHIHSIRPRRRSLAVFSAITASVLPATALATPGGGSGMPWESPFQTVLDSIQGMAPIFLTIAFIIAGLTWAFGESGGLSRKAVGLVAGGSLVIGAAPAITTLFQGASGLLL